MRSTLKQLAFKIYIKLFLLYGKYIFKCRSKHAAAVALKAYTLTFSLFPTNKLKTNSYLADCIQRRLFGWNTPDYDSNIDEEQLDVLCKKIESNDWVRQTTSNYFLLEAFYFSFGRTSESKDKADIALNNAKSHISTAVALSNNDIAPLCKAINSDIKRLKKEIRKLNSDRITSEKEKIITPISITSSGVLFIVSIFSSLFLISGFAYNKMFFYGFDISVGDFFGVSDYIASSVDVLVATTIAAFVGIVFFLLGIGDALTKRIHTEQFEVERKDRDYIIIGLILFSSIGIVEHAFRTGEIHTPFLFGLSLFLSFELLLHIPLSRYIKNDAPVMSALISVTYFSIHLGVTTIGKVQDIKSGRYNSRYSVEFDEKYERFASSEYISSNLNYIFLWDKKIRKIHVLPKTAVTVFHSK